MSTVTTVVLHPTYSAHAPRSTLGKLQIFLGEKKLRKKCSLSPVLTATERQGRFEEAVFWMDGLGTNSTFLLQVRQQGRQRSPMTTFKFLFYSPIFYKPLGGHVQGRGG